MYVRAYVPLCLWTGVGVIYIYYVSDFSSCDSSVAKTRIPFFLDIYLIRLSYKNGSKLRVSGRNRHIVRLMYPYLMRGIGTRSLFKPLNYILTRLRCHVETWDRHHICSVRIIKPTSHQVELGSLSAEFENDTAWRGLNFASVRRGGGLFSVGFAILPRL